MNCLNELAGAGYRLIPLRSGENAKKPRDEGYATKNYTLAELSGNVGLIVDQEVVDVDLDWPETQRLSGLRRAELRCSLPLRRQNECEWRGRREFWNGL